MNNIAFSPKEQLRYERHFSLKQIGEKGQLLLKNAKVLCVGAGGLGNPLSLYLAAAGVGTLGIIDDDVVDFTNLQRQILFAEHEVGKPKVEILKQKITELNPNSKVNTYKTRLIKANALEIISEYDVIADGTDNFATRYLINDACFTLNTPNVYASIFQFEGQCSVFYPGITPCYRCLFSNPPPQGLIPNCAEGGVLGVLPGIMGTIQATEVIKLITKIGQALTNRMLLFDALKMQFRELPLRKNPECIICSLHTPFDDLPYYDDYIARGCSLNNSVKTISVTELKNRLAKKENIFLLDVREPEEYKKFNIGGKLIPLHQLQNHLHQLNSTDFIVIICKCGERSKIACEILEKAGFNSVYNLAGGIDELKKPNCYYKNVDP